MLASCLETLALICVCLCLDNKITNINTSLFMTLVMSFSQAQFIKQDSDTVPDMYRFQNNWWIKIHCAHFSSASFQHYFCMYINHLLLQPHVLQFVPSCMTSEDENFTFTQTGFVKCMVQTSVTRTATSHCAPVQQMHSKWNTKCKQ